MKRVILLIIILLYGAPLYAAWDSVPSFFIGISTARIIEFHNSMFNISKNADFNSKKVKGVFIDLNGDGKKDLVLIGNSCGTGGCPFEIYDGSSQNKIGELFGGAIWVFKEKINGWPILQIYSHGSATSGSFICDVFDGKEYTTVSHVYLYDKSVEDLFNKYKAVPELTW